MPRHSESTVLDTIMAHDRRVLPFVAWPSRAAGCQFSSGHGMPDHGKRGGNALSQ